MYLHLREANAALRDAIVRGETIQAKDVINLSRDVRLYSPDLHREIRLTPARLNTLATRQRDHQGGNRRDREGQPIRRSGCRRDRGRDVCFKVRQVWSEPYAILPDADKECGRTDDCEPFRVMRELESVN